MYTVIEEKVYPHNIHYRNLPENKTWFRIKFENGRLSYSAYLNKLDAEKVCFKKNLEIPIKTT